MLFLVPTAPYLSAIRSVQDDRDNYRIGGHAGAVVDSIIFVHMHTGIMCEHIM